MTEMRQVWTVAHDGPAPTMSGPSTTHHGEWSSEELAVRAMKVVANRLRAPKTNLRVETRFVSEWTTTKRIEDA